MIVTSSCSHWMSGKKAAALRSSILRETTFPDGVDSAIVRIERKTEALTAAWPTRITPRRFLVIRNFVSEIHILQSLNRSDGQLSCSEPGKPVNVDSILTYDFLPPQINASTNTSSRDTKQPLISARMEETLIIANELQMKLDTMMKRQIEIQKKKAKLELELLQKELKARCQADSIARQIQLKQQITMQELRVRRAADQVKAAFPQAYRRSLHDPH